MQRAEAAERAQQPESEATEAVIVSATKETVTLDDSPLQPAIAKRERKLRSAGVMHDLASADAALMAAGLISSLASCEQVDSGLCEQGARLAVQADDCAETFVFPRGAVQVLLEDDGAARFVVEARTSYARCVDGTWQVTPQ